MQDRQTSLGGDRRASPDAAEATVISGLEWRAMATGFGWMLGSFSSLEVTITSILFVVVYITLYTLCINCFSSSQSPETPHYSQEKETPSSILQKEQLEDQQSTNRTSGNAHVSSVPQVPARPHTRTYTMVQSQQPKVHSHNRAESHGYFSQGMMPRLPDTPVLSIGSTGSVHPRIANPPPLPSTFHLPRVQVEPAVQPSSLQQPKTVIKHHDTSGKEDQTHTNGMFTDHLYSLPELMVSEEHTYESISMVDVREPSPLSSSDKAAEDQSDSESLYQTIREPSEPAAGHPFTSLTVLDKGQAEKQGKLFLAPPAEQDGQCLTGMESMPVYAAVNWKNKSVKLVDFHNSPATTAPDEDDVTEEVAPPIPEKLFE